MSLDKNIKHSIIEKFRRVNSDTGSPEVQTALLSHQIETVTSHLAKHAKDDHTRRGLIKMISKRRRLLNYLKSKSPERFRKLAKMLKI